MAEYQLTATESVIRTEDGAWIPNDPANRDWVKYQEWLADGGVPDPYVAPPEIEPDEKTIAPDTALLYEHENRLLELEGKPPTNIRDFVKKVKSKSR